MRVLVAILIGASLALPARAQTVRVAVANGPTLVVRGHRLMLRANGSPAVPVGPTVTLQAVGPFVSDGSELAARVSLVDASGGRLEVGGVKLLGEVQVVATQRALFAVDRVDLETYVASVVGAEMPATWPMAALEAQAIAARTYALSRQRAAKDAPFDVDASVLSQVYGGAASIDPRTREAARATKGEVLTYGGALAQTFFFADCTGETESAAAAFGEGEPYLVSTSCDGGDDAPMAHWTKRIGLTKLSRALEKSGALGDELQRIDVVERTTTGRVARARLVTRHGARTVDGAELRRLIGYQALPSLDAKFEKRGDMLVVEGSGAGHGVGLCQWCARGRAMAGDSAEEILARAYPGTQLTTAK